MKAILLQIWMEREPLEPVLEIVSVLVWEEEVNMVTHTAKWAGTVAVDLAEPPKTSQNWIQLNKCRVSWVRVPPEAAHFSLEK